MNNLQNNNIFSCKFRYMNCGIKYTNLERNLCLFNKFFNGLTLLKYMGYIIAIPDCKLCWTWNQLWACLRGQSFVICWGDGHQLLPIEHMLWVPRESNSSSMPAYVCVLADFMPTWYKLESLERKEPQLRKWIQVVGRDGESGGLGLVCKMEKYILNKKIKMFGI